MHPDAILAALRTELAEFPERKTEIEAEIKRVDALPRPVATAEEPDTTTVAARARSFVAGLRAELREAPERKDEIEAEIKRVESEIANADKSERARREAHRATNEPRTEHATSGPSAGRGRSNR